MWRPKVYFNAEMDSLDTPSISAGVPLLVSKFFVLWEKSNEINFKCSKTFFRRQNKLERFFLESILKPKCLYKS